MQLKLHNTLTKQTEVFTPLDPENKVVSFYTCGPTVYDFAHIGNFRAFLNADVLRRSLELLGYKVNQVMNITDVGHMTDDSVADGGGEDKMEVAAARFAEAKKSGELPDGVSVNPNDPEAIAEFYTNAFMQDSEALGMRIVGDAKQNPSLMPRPTQYIQEMIATVETLIASDHAYVASDGVVYFSVETFDDYGKLSGNTIETLRSGEGGRVDMATQEVKRSPADFMLWKPDATHLMRWQSPWGEGYPGWHLECSVMANSLLGNEIDLHSGGEDNIFPHHECEIAQSRCVTGCDAFSRYWFHTRFLLVDGSKMSKSKGNFYTLRDLLDKGATAAAVRLELIKTHYRSNANFTMQGLKDSQRQIDRWRRLKDWLTAHREVASPENGPLQIAREQFVNALCDDLNVSGAIGALNEAVNVYALDAEPEHKGTSTLQSELDALLEMDSVLGVLDLIAKGGSGDINVEEVDALIEARLTARQEKEWNRADEIRDELLKMGVAIKDGPTGTTWSRIVQ